MKAFKEKVETLYAQERNTAMSDEKLHWSAKRMKSVMISCCVIREIKTRKAIASVGR